MLMFLKTKIVIQPEKGVLWSVDMCPPVTTANHATGYYMHLNYSLENTRIQIRLFEIIINGQTQTTFICYIFNNI